VPLARLLSRINNHDGIFDDFDHIMLAAAQNHPSAAAMHNFKKSQVRAARKARFPAAIHT
jgi:hypothetical protein